jgi:pantoate--beta-alanine ligase
VRTVRTTAELGAALSEWRVAGDDLAFVPTMGHLHAGHMALVARAQMIARRIVVSIFVNPLQFDRPEDLDRYPRSLQADARMLESEGVDLLFAPPQEELYPHGREHLTRIQVPELGDILEGAHRPGHFSGVATVVCKLFNLVGPAVAVFGEKDFQQLLIIRRMVVDLNMPVDVVAEPTVREADGLAMSSRNSYLEAPERARASLLYQALTAVRRGVVTGQGSFAELEEASMHALERGGFRPEYVSLRRRSDLAVAQPSDREIVVLAAAWLGRARLIDNLSIDLPTRG